MWLCFGALKICSDSVLFWITYSFFGWLFHILIYFDDQFSRFSFVFCFSAFGIGILLLPSGKLFSVSVMVISVLVYFELNFPQQQTIGERCFSLWECRFDLPPSHSQPISLHLTIFPYFFYRCHIVLSSVSVTFFKLNNEGLCWMILRRFFGFSACWSFWIWISSLQ